MSNTQTPQNKQPKMIEVKVLVPWMIIVIMFALVSGVIGGWFIHAGAQSDARKNVIPVATLKDK